MLINNNFLEIAAYIFHFGSYYPKDFKHLQENEFQKKSCFQIALRLFENRKLNSIIFLLKELIKTGNTTFLFQLALT